eukprot:jgi/Mesvir1/21245/Mv06674-RA.1
MPIAVVHHSSRGTHVKIADPYGNDVKLFVRAEGPEDGEHVLCVHGIFTSSFIFRKVMPLLAAKRLRAISLDLPGSGLSDKPVVSSQGSLTGVDYSPAYLAECLRRAVTVLGLPPVHLVLHDTAGRLSAHVSEHTHPPRFGLLTKPLKFPYNTCLTFVDASVAYPFPSAFPAWAFASPSPVVRAIAQRLVRAPLLASLVLRRCCSSRIATDDVAAHLYLQRRGQGADLPALVAAAAAHLNATEGYGAHLRRVLATVAQSVPKQAVWSQAHHGSREEWQRQIRFLEAFAGDETRMFSHGVAPWSPEDAPQELADDVASLVARLARTPPVSREEDMPEHP